MRGQLRSAYHCSEVPLVGSVPSYTLHLDSLKRGGTFRFKGRIRVGLWLLRHCSVFKIPIFTISLLLFLCLFSSPRIP